MTSLGVDTTELLRAGSYIYYYVVKPLFTYDVYPDMEYLESCVQKELLQVCCLLTSSLSVADTVPKYDWTIIRPPGLKTVNDKKYRTQRGQALPGGGWLGRAQLADNLLDLLNDSSSFHQTVYTAL